MTKEQSEVKDLQSGVKVTKSTVVKGSKPVKGMLFSRLNYAVSVKYKGEEAVVSPNAKLNIDDVSKLEKDNLPKGLILRIID